MPEARRPINIYAEAGEERYPIALTQWCNLCYGKGVVGVEGDVRSQCPKCRGHRTVATLNGKGYRQFIAECMEGMG